MLICCLQLTYSFILRWNINDSAAETVTDDMFVEFRNSMPEFAEVGKGYG